MMNRRTIFGRIALCGLTASISLGAQAAANAAVLLIDHPDARPHSVRGDYKPGDDGYRPAQIGALGVNQSNAVADMNGVTTRVFELQEFSVDIARGIGRDLLLTEALPMIVPQGWDVSYLIPPGAKQRNVTWRGGAKWTYVLQEVMEQSGLFAFVDPQNKSVKISTSPYFDEWEVFNNDKSIRVTLSRWAKASGWQLVWDIDRDFPVESEAMVKGSFETAVTKVVEALNTSDYPIKALFYQQSKTLRVIKYTEGSRSYR